MTEANHEVGPFVFHAQGDADDYCFISNDKRWVISFRVNGELMTKKQEDTLRLMTAAYNAFESAAKRVGVNAVELAERMADGGIADLHEKLCGMVGVFNTKDIDQLQAFVAIEQASHAIAKVKP